MFGVSESPVAPSDPQPTTKLDEDTRTATAFAGWAQFVQLCHTGYVPTLYPDRGPLAEQEAATRLRSALAEEGCKFWPPAAGEVDR